MALIIHVCNALSNNEKPDAVSEIKMLKAMLLGNYFKAQTKRAFCIMTEDNILSQSKSIINWCKPNIDKIKSLRVKEGYGEILAIKPSDLLRNRILTGIHTNKAAEQALTRLVDYNWL